MGDGGGKGGASIAEISMSNVVPVVEICFASGHVACEGRRGGERISKTKSTTLLDKFRRGNEEEEK